MKKYTKLIKKIVENNIDVIEQYTQKRDTNLIIEEHKLNDIKTHISHNLSDFIGNNIEETKNNIADYVNFEIYEHIINESQYYLSEGIINDLLAKKYPDISIDDMGGIASSIIKGKDPIYYIKRFIIWHKDRIAAASENIAKHKEYIAKINAMNPRDVTANMRESLEFAYTRLEDNKAWLEKTTKSLAQLKDIVSDPEHFRHMFDFSNIFQNTNKFDIAKAFLAKIVILINKAVNYAIEHQNQYMQYF